MPLPILGALGRFAVSAGTKMTSGLGGLLTKFAAPGGIGGLAARAGSSLMRGLSNPFIGGAVGTAAGFGLGQAMFGGDDQGGGVGDPENVQAASGDVIATLLDGGSDSMVRAAWRAARAMGATPQSLYALIRSMDAEPVDKMMISNELERILKPKRRRRSAVPKSIIRSLQMLKAIQGLVSMRIKAKAIKRGRFGRG